VRRYVKIEKNIYKRLSPAAFKKSKGKRSCNFQKNICKCLTEEFMCAQNFNLTPSFASFFQKIDKICDFQPQTYLKTFSDKPKFRPPSCFHCHDAIGYHINP